MFKLLAERETVESIEAKVGVSNRVVNGIVRSASLMLQANDDAVDDFLNLVESWGDTHDGIILGGIAESDDPSQYLIDEPISVQSDDSDQRQSSSQRKQAALEQFEREWSATDMRDLGGSLIRLADAIDQQWNSIGQQSSFRWPSAAAKIERNAIELAKKATLLRRQTDMRETFIPADLLGEPAW
ncbi:MAG: hypothetical protein AAF687_11935, partial [Pseudomonadota bacterium]